MPWWSCSGSHSVARSALACALLVTACTPLKDARSDAGGGGDAAAAEGLDDEDAADVADGAGASSVDASGEGVSSEGGPQTDAAADLTTDAGGGDGTDAAQGAGGNADTGTQSSPDHCASAPCVHGTCTNEADDFSCGCSGPWAGTRCDKPMFQPLGTISGMTDSEARGVSADGSVVVGIASRSSPSSAFAAIQWKATTGLVQLPSSGLAQANAVAGDGLTVVGHERPTGSSIGYATRWIGGAKAGAYAAPLVNDMSSGAHALAISSDGTVAAGLGEYVNEYPKAVRWVAAAGTIERIDPSGHEESYACGISGNGSVVVGYTYNPDSAFVWRAGDAGLTALPTLDADSGSSARAVSQDGKVIVGSSGGLAVRWVDGASPVSLGLAGVAYGANTDGSVIVGRTGTAFVWRSSAVPQLQLLADVLLSAGANLSGWTLEQASAVSIDGSTVVGFGTHDGSREGFIARLR